MTSPTLKPGPAWRIGRQSGFPLKCVVIGQCGINVVVKASRFSRDEQIAYTADVFADREACRAEIQRRREATEGEADGI